MANLTAKELAALKLVRKRMSGPDGKMSFSSSFLTDAIVKGSESATEFINEETRLWRHSWIVPVLDAIIAKQEGRATLSDETHITYAAKEYAQTSKK